MKKKKGVKKAPPKKIKKSTEPKIGTYMGLEYESFCELSFIYFAEELIKKGYVSKIERGKSYLLCDPLVTTHVVQLKRGSKHESQTISHGVTYTPDYDIYFTEKALGLFCWELGSGEKWDKALLVAQRTQDGLLKACVEVKPDFSRNSTTPKSMLVMKWLYQKRGIFVNLFRPNRIFEGLFVPSKYRITSTGKQRLLKFKARNLEEYLKLKRVKNE